MNVILKFLQSIVAADTTAIEAAAVNVAVALVAGFGFSLPASAVGVITALVAAGLGWFVHKHFAAKLAAK